MQEEERQERAEHREEAERLCAQCEAAIAKNQFSNATSILASILEEFGKAGLDEDEREAAVRALPSVYAATLPSAYASAICARGCGMCAGIALSPRASLLYVRFHLSMHPPYVRMHVSIQAASMCA